jgi:hypothetical protein
VKDKDEDKSDQLDQTTVHRFLSSLEVAENIMARNPKDVETTDNKESVADPANS